MFRMHSVILPIIRLNLVCIAGFAYMQYNNNFLKVTYEAIKASITFLTFDSAFPPLDIILSDPLID